MTKEKWIKVFIALIVAIGLYFLPYDSFGVAINPVEKRVISIFALAALLWILEPFPIWTTSMLVIVTMLLTVSNHGLLLCNRMPQVLYANLISYKAIMATLRSNYYAFLGRIFLSGGGHKISFRYEPREGLIKTFWK